MAGSINVWSALFLSAEGIDFTGAAEVFAASFCVDVPASSSSSSPNLSSKAELIRLISSISFFFSRPAGGIGGTGCPGWKAADPGTACGG
jgi:hypothetical protein